MICRQAFSRAFSVFPWAEFRLVYCDQVIFFSDTLFLAPFLRFPKLSLDWFIVIRWHSFQSRFCRAFSLTCMHVSFSSDWLICSGLFHILRLPRLNSLVCHAPESFDLAFKLRRKKMTIEVQYTLLICRFSVRVLTDKHLLASYRNFTYPQISQKRSTELRKILFEDSLGPCHVSPLTPGLTSERT